MFLMSYSASFVLENDRQKQAKTPPHARGTRWKREEACRWVRLVKKKAGLIGEAVDKQLVDGGDAIVAEIAGS